MAENEFNPLNFSAVARPNNRSDDLHSNDCADYGRGSVISTDDDLADTRFGSLPARETAADRALASGDYPHQQFAEIRADVERRIRERPLAAVGLAVVIGYVLGATR